MAECMTQEDAMNMSNEQAVQILSPMREMMRDQNGCPISDAYFAIDKAITALKKTQWISVEERLPERRRSVLIYCPRYKNAYTAFLDDDGGWVHFGGPIYAVSNTVTHWAPIPEPPKEENK